MTSAVSKGWSVYVLRCGDGSLYTGATNDVSKRLETHRRGKGAAYTRSRLPVELIYCEALGSRGAALRREAAIKRLSRAQKLALIAGSGDSTSRLAPAGTGWPPPAGTRTGWNDREREDLPSGS